MSNVECRMSSVEWVTHVPDERRCLRCVDTRAARAPFLWALLSCRGEGTSEPLLGGASPGLSRGISLGIA
jgi:hypothetical protein